MKALRVLAVLVAVLVILLVIVDRVGVRVAENEAAKKLQTSQNLSAKPKVTIEGFPFLTQAIARKLRSVRVQASDLAVQRSGRTVRITRLDAHLKNVTASSNLSSGTVQSGSGTAVISYPDLSSALGVSVGYAGPGSDGRGTVKATKSVSVLGNTISASVTATVDVQGNTVTFGSPSVSAGGVSLPPGVSQSLTGVFAKPIVLGTLPIGLRVQSVTATADGVTFVLTAHNVTIGS
ncbi:MAG TPA: DUF2993 domain-containing protein [Jatrophihabitans sp.]